MVLSVHEESLIEIVRSLPPDEAAQILEWARHLGDLAGHLPIEWSDSWSDADLAEASAAAARRFNAQDGENC